MPDAELFDLIARHRPVLARFVELDEDPTATRAARDAADQVLSEVENTIELFMPRTVAGLAAKARWVIERDPRHATTFTDHFVRQVATFIQI